ncbi:hypothetical protein B0H19DRAFT_1072099 [Mycena capillaripes]|nr:hypothetical protein B0H19DRAFT_1072099 [Mycena capillaripes]
MFLPIPQLGFSVLHVTFMDDAMCTEAVLKLRAPPNASTDNKMYTWMKYPVLVDTPFLPSTVPLWLLFCGIVPAENWDKRDFALNRFIQSVQNCYISKCALHWIALYFCAHPFLTYTGADVTTHAKRGAAWLCFRYSTRDYFQDPVVAFSKPPEVRFGWERMIAEIHGPEGGEHDPRPTSEMPDRI